MLLTESIAIGLVLGFIAYERIGLSPGGFVVPGYLALYLDRPLMVASTLTLAWATHLVVEGISRFAIVYGRRRFMLCLLTAFAGQWLIELAAWRTGIVPVEARSQDDRIEGIQPLLTTIQLGEEILQGDGAGVQVGGQAGSQPIFELNFSQTTFPVGIITN